MPALPPPRSLDAVCSVDHVGALGLIGELAGDELWPSRIELRCSPASYVADLWGRTDLRAPAVSDSVEKDSSFVFKI